MGGARDKEERRVCALGSPLPVSRLFLGNPSARPFCPSLLLRQVKARLGA